VTWRLTGATFSIFLVVLGLLFYIQTLDRRHGWETAAWILAVIWSALVFVTFVLSAYHAHPDYSGIPVWMQVASPYVYASTPLLLVWGMRIVIPTLWDMSGLR
jgi:ATP/ADP translocase